ncbi:ribosome biogenesis GTPase YlqF [Planifilum fulgidum]|nr:ribosome biogenesis GTPase YlqF [Planifilum fulgidum]
MTIQWFPGHMAKARRQVEEKIKMVDVVLELLDARLPQSSRNPLIDRLVGDRPRIVLMMKSDLADEAVTDEWVRFFRGRDVEAVPIDAENRRQIAEIPRVAGRLLEEKKSALERKGIRFRRIRAMVLGIPNVGKSTLINRLAGRSAARTGDRPGVTRGQQWIRVGNTMEILDTPGILWPKLEDPRVGLRLAASGAIREEILPLEEVAAFLLRYLRGRYPDRLRERYRLEDLPPAEGADLLEEVGRRRGCVAKGGVIDREKAAEIVLRDFRSGRFGRVSLERPADWLEDGEGTSDESAGNDPGN